MAGIKRTNEVFYIQNEAKKNGESLTLQQIGDRMKPPVTAERVRQIIREDEFRNNYCDIHKCKYEEICQFCETTLNYEKFLSTLVNESDFESEFRRLSVELRTKDLVIQRAMLIQKAKKKFGYSYVKMGRMMNRDHSSIKYLNHIEIKRPKLKIKTNEI